MTKRQDALDYHSNGRPGKIAVVPTKPLDQPAGSLARLLARRRRAVPRDRAGHRPRLQVHRQGQPRRASSPTAPPCSGSATSARIAGKPVMEGKANLFKQFADLDVFDLEVGSENPGRRHQVLPAARADGRRHQPRGHPRAGLLLHRGDAAEDAARSPSSTTTSTARRSSPAPRCSTRSRSSARRSTTIQGRLLRRRRRRDLDRRALRAARRAAREHHSVRPRTA